MAKTLVIIRHGKSTWDYPSVHDIDRPLKEIGICNTILTAQKIKENNILPDIMISSPANRALHTALITARELGFPVEKIIIDSRIYSKSAEEILPIIKSTDNSFSCLFVFGHNPVFTIIPNTFLKYKIDNLPTSGAAIFEFNTSSWSEISNKNVKKEICHSPKNL
jgi:phosphohistidine phosphatase